MNPLSELYVSESGQLMHDGWIVFMVDEYSGYSSER